jgi:WD40 repeat protein
MVGTLVLVGLALGSPRAEVGQPLSAVTGASGPQLAPLLAAGERIPDADAALRQLERRCAYVSVAVHPSGALIAAACRDRIVRLFDVKRRAVTRRLVGHLAAVTALAFSPDGATLASASRDRTVRLWDPASGKPLRVLNGHAYHVVDIAFSPDGKAVASVSWDRTLQVWDLKSGQPRMRSAALAAPLRCVSFSPDGALIAVGAEGGQIHLFTTGRPAPTQRLVDGDAAVAVVAFTRDGRSIVSGSEDHTVRVWARRGGRFDEQPRARLRGHRAAVLALATDPRGHLAASGAADGTLCLWDVHGGRRLMRIAGHGAAVTAVRFAQEGAVIVSGSADRTIGLWDAATFHAVGRLQGHAVEVSSMAFSHDGRLLAAGMADGRTAIWQPRTGRLAAVLSTHRGPVTGVAFDHRAAPRLATASVDGSVRVFKLPSGGASLRVSRDEWHASRPTPLRAVAFSLDSARLVTAGDDGAVRIWRATDGRPLRTLEGHRKAVTSLAFAPSGEQLASGSLDGTVRLWAVPAGRPLRILAHGAAVLDTAFRGQLVAGSTADTKLKLWRAKTGRRYLVYERRRGALRGVAFSHDGRFTAAVGDAATLEVWINGQRRARQARVGDAPLTAVAFGPESRDLAVASTDGAIRIYEPETLRLKWTLLCGAEDLWVACRDDGTCWRRDDGTLLLRRDRAGRLSSYLPEGAKRPARLAIVGQAGATTKKAELLDGSRVPLRVTVKNHGAHPVYWIRLTGRDRPGRSDGSLVLAPPPPHLSLPPGRQVTLAGALSAVTAYRSPRGVRRELALRVQAAGSSDLEHSVAVVVRAPRLTLSRLRIPRGEPNVILASLGQVDMLQGDRLRLDATLSRGGPLDAISLTQRLHGQGLQLSFVVPNRAVQREGLVATLEVRKPAHPMHVWTFDRRPVERPAPLSRYLVPAAALLLAAAGLMLLRWRRPAVYAAVGRGIALTAAAVWNALRLLPRLFALPRHLGRLFGNRRLRRLTRVFWELAPETRCSLLSQKLDTRWQPLASEPLGLYALEVSEEGFFPLNADRLVLAFVDRPVEARELHHLLDRAAPWRPQQLVVALCSSEPQASTLRQGLTARPDVAVVGPSQVNAVLAARSAAVALSRVAAAQLDPAAFCPYQPGRNRFHFGRALAAGREGSTTLVIGGAGLGKTSLLHATMRRLRAVRPARCRLASAADEGGLGGALCRLLKLPPGSDDDEIASALEQLLREDDEAGGGVLLVDDADHVDGETSGWQTLLSEAMRRCAGHRSRLIATGAARLAAWARESARRLAEHHGRLVTLGPLDRESGVQLAIEPMRWVDLDYRSDAVVDQLLQETGCRPDLLELVCRQMAVRTTGDDPRHLGPEELSRALYAPEVQRAVERRLDPLREELDSAVARVAAVHGREGADREALQQGLAELGFHPGPPQLEDALQRLSLSHVVKTHADHRLHVPIPIVRRALVAIALRG